MSSRPDPFDLPDWQALHREASLVSQLIGSGATALGRASYGSGFGEYYTAFFGLSIGIERLAKLILISNFAMNNNGALPSQAVVKKFGHNISGLIEKADEIAKSRSIVVKHIGPSEPICAAVIECLGSFADASKGRYANFQAIGNPHFDPRTEPVTKWWNDVIEPILDKHYSGRRAEAGVKDRAKFINALIGDMAFVRHTDENGRLMSDVETASERTGQTKWAQRYGRFYTLAVVRWLACIFSNLVREASYKQGIDNLFGHDEFFSSYMVDDNFLLDRKIWPLT
ncbi:hypothetical protein [Sphingomonas sp. Leaf198]|uniref:hypothetical protein n=1 Tax=Sphingomonas sp. Leaf198 TaxID=1736299 RepID=UPI000B2B846D|nr:hypothetical protein [Sphingomonas sp. Leaf198]